MSEEDLVGTQTECAECGVVGRHKVIDSRPIGSPSKRTNRRRKECPGCGHRYTTYEIPADRYLETEELEKWKWQLYLSGQAGYEVMKALRQEIREDERRARVGFTATWSLNKHIHKVILDSVAESLLDGCVQTLAGRPWILSKGEPSSFCDGSYTRSEWEEAVTGKTYPEDLFRLGGLIKIRSPRGELLNAFTLLPAAWSMTKL